MWKISLRKLSVVAIATGLLGFPALSATAADRGDVNIGEGQIFDFKQPAFTTTRPPTVLLAQTKPAACRGQRPDPEKYPADDQPLIQGATTYCDGYHIVVKPPPPGFRDVYGIEMTLDYVRGTTSPNDVYMFAWPDDSPTYGAPIAWADGRPDDDYGAAQDPVRAARVPKIILLAEPLEFWLTVVNIRGQSTGYSLRFKWVEIDLGDLPEIVRTKFTPSSGFSTPSSGTNLTPFLSDDGAFLPTSKTRKVLQPGPDGQLREVSLPVLTRGDRSPGKKGGLDPLVAGVAAALLASGAGLSFFAIRARRKAA